MIKKEGIGQPRFCFFCCGLLSYTMFSISHLTKPRQGTCDIWREFYQYFRESKFIHIMSLDFTLLYAFAPFWVYNDMTARKWYDKGFWLLPLSLVPFLGPALYLVLWPSLSDLPVTVGTTT